MLSLLQQIQLTQYTLLQQVRTCIFPLFLHFVYNDKTLRAAMDHNSKISLNVHLQVPSTTSQDGSHTPNTPEILNTIVNMTAGPFAPDFFRSSNHHHQMAPPPPSQSTYTSTSSSTSTIATSTRAAALAMAPPVTASQLSPIAEENPVYNIASEPGLSYADVTAMDTTSGSSASTSEYASTPGSSMSVQAYTSQFIKEGLRIKMRQKMGSGGEISGTLPGLPSPTRSPTAATATAAWESEGSKTPPGSKLAVKRINVNELAPQDAVRRLRRRERNKVAATKCRNKKKARTGILMKESEILDAQNKALKLEISKLESEKHHLMDILQEHEPSCAKKFKDTMKVRHQSGGFEFPSTSSSTQDSEFRVPLPPASMVVASGGGRVPMIKVTASTPEETDPPTFAEAIQMVTEVKEEEEEISAYSLDGYFGHHSGQNTAPLMHEDYFNQQMQNPFLAKRSLGQTYLDLDSRCIAL